jgi:hypothetical protein
MSILDLVTDPEPYMERKASGRSLRCEAIVLLVVGALGVPGVVYAGQEIASNMAADTGDILMVGLAIEPLIGIYLIWFGSVITAHIIANRFYNSREPILRLLKTSAWAFVPIGIGNLAQSGALYLIFQDPDLPSDPEVTTALEVARSLISSVMDEPVYLVGFGVLIITVLYSGYLFSFSIQKAKEIPHDDALKVAAVPTVVLVIYFVQELI